MKLLICVITLILSSCTTKEPYTTSALKIKQEKGILSSLTDEDLFLMRKHNPEIAEKIEKTYGLNIEEIIKLQSLGVSSDAIIEILIYTKSQFSLSTSDVIRMQMEGVSHKVINYMIRT
ncbi:MAG: hypothetical protein JSR76_02120 [Verrucomicrobia bacterium]|nr:hypothetical protein [Verrucomicrobiota bacterium]